MTGQRGRHTPAEVAYFKRRAMKQGVRFARGEVKAHMLLNHPGCPEDIVKYVVYMLRRERWDVPIGRAVGITLQNYVRHHITNYDDLYRIKGLTQEEARLIVRGAVNDIIRDWAPKVVLRPVPPGSASDDAASLGEA